MVFSPKSTPLDVAAPTAPFTTQLLRMEMFSRNETPVAVAVADCCTVMPSRLKLVTLKPSMVTPSALIVIAALGLLLPIQLSIMVSPPLRATPVAATPA